MTKSPNEFFFELHLVAKTNRMFSIAVNIFINVVEDMLKIPPTSGPPQENVVHEMRGLASRADSKNVSNPTCLLND